MDERGFWSALEYRVTREMAGSELCASRGLWCDGFLAAASEAMIQGGIIRGRVWVGLDGRKQQAWEFLLRLPGEQASTPLQDWSALLPPEDETDWLAVDIEGGRLEIDLRT